MPLYAAFVSLIYNFNLVVDTLPPKSFCCEIQEKLSGKGDSQKCRLSHTTCLSGRVGARPGLLYCFGWEIRNNK